MLRNRDIIIFGDDWGRHPSTIQHMGRVLLDHNRVLWINSLGSRTPKLNFNDFTRAIQKVIGFFHHSMPATTPSNLHILQPIVIPFFDLPMVRRINSAALYFFLKREMNRLKFKKPVVLTATPLSYDLIGKLGETSSHYICLDDYSEFHGLFKSLKEMEELTLQRIDAVFATSEILLRIRKPKTGHAYFLPQGVDVDHFSPGSTQCPIELQALAKPIVGFYGLIASWVDTALMLRAAKRYPNVTFVLIGRIADTIDAIHSENNVVYLGEKPYADLPRYASQFDVALIPFVRNDLTLAANPLKLLEYLALGLPVVSTDLPEVSKFKGSVYLAKSDEEFIDLIEIAIKLDSPEARLLRRQEARKLSWQRVVNGLSDCIEKVEMTES